MTTDPDEVQAEVEHVVCGGCGRMFEIMTAPDRSALLYDPATSLADRYQICPGCSGHLWIDDGEDGDRVIQFFSVEDRASVAAQMRRIPDRLPTPEETDRIMACPGWLVRLLAWLLARLTESSPSPGQK